MATIAEPSVILQMADVLTEWYFAHRRDFPWRSDPTPYHVWVSEIMLQQTRIGAVLEYYARFMEALPDIRALAEADEERLMKLWQGLGYYSRARNLKKAAGIVVEKFGGIFPSSYEDILSLPGIGEYTAGAIASIALGIAVPCVDGNVLRVMARLTGDEGDVTSPAMKRKVRDMLFRDMPREHPGAFNQALMELGETVCVPNGAPLCGECPLREICAAHRENRTGDLPRRSEKKPRRIERRAVDLLFYGDCVAIRQRPAKGLLAGLWEYPNRTEDEPEEKWNAVSVREGPSGRHIFTHIEWHMKSRIVRLADPDLPEGWVWANKEELMNTYAIPGAFDIFRDAVCRCLSEEA